MRLNFFSSIVILTLSLLFGSVASANPKSSWNQDLAPISELDWNKARAKHLLERAGFGGTPEEIEKLYELGPAKAVHRLVYNDGIKNSLPEFDHSGVHDPGIEPFPASRPAATKLAEETGEAIGVKIKPDGNRRLQPVVDRFFYWLRASMLESHRVAYWWANRMLQSERPLEEKMTLFWHGHFATSEDKVRDYRKMLIQNELFRKYGTGNFRDLLIKVSQDPAMLAFLDAGVNVKGSPNENFAREIMELFTMGVGNYAEEDIREGARAFTGWNFSDLTFVVNSEQHDETQKNFLGKTGTWDGIDVIDIILEQPVTAEYISSKIYKYFVREEIEPNLKRELGNAFRESNYDIAKLMELIFLSKDFYSAEAVASRIKPPAELLISTYRKMGLESVPGVPDFNETTEMLGQRLLFPPTVAGWAGGRSWMTPGLLLARGNFVYDTVFPNINFIPNDRYPGDNYQVGVVADRLAQGFDVGTATQPADRYVTSASNDMVDRDESFNTRLGSYRGWRMAIEKVKPLSRHTAHLNLTEMVIGAGCKTPTDVIEYFENRFFSLQLDTDTKNTLVTFLREQLGTDDLISSSTYSEEGLRATLHLLLSLPEYQLG